MDSYDAHRTYNKSRWMRAVAKLPTGDHRKRMAVVVVRHADRRDYGKLPPPHNKRLTPQLGRMAAAWRQLANEPVEHRGGQTVGCHFASQFPAETSLLFA